MDLTTKGLVWSSVFRKIASYGLLTGLRNGLAIFVKEVAVVFRDGGLRLEIKFRKGGRDA